MVQPLQQQHGYHGLTHCEGRLATRSAITKAIADGEDPALLAALSRRQPTTQEEPATNG